MTGEARARAFTDWVVRHGRLLWLVAVLVSAPAFVQTARLYAGLKSAFEELLPRSSESVVAIEELRARVAGLQYLAVVVDTATAENLPAAERFLDDLGRRIETYPRDLVRAVRVGDEAERAFLRRYGGLYLDLDDLREIRTRIEARRDWEVREATGGSLEEDDAPPPLDFSDIEAKYRARTGETKRATARFSSAEDRTTLLLVEMAEFSTGQNKSNEILSRVRRDIAELGGTERYAPGMRVGFAGDVAISVEETTALLSDLAFSSVVVGVLVVTVIVWFFRTPRALAAILPPLLVATALAFALASLPLLSVTELNSNTAFLGSIVVGNGINPGIMLVARFVEERREGTPFDDAIARAVHGTATGTFTAALAASVAYGSLVLTDFRGFRQFGAIGGMGMLLCWGAAFVLVPPLLAGLDPKAGWSRATARTGRRARLASPLARVVRERPAVLVALAMLGTTASLALATRVDASWIEHDVSRLRASATWETGEGYWGRRMDRLLGRYLTPIAILTDHDEDAERVAARLREEIDRGTFGDLLANVRASSDVVPRRQEEKIAEIERIREAMTPRLRAAIPPERQESVRPLIEGEPPRVITLDDVPRTFTTGLREMDGHVGRIVLAFPRPSRSLWEGPTLQKLVRPLRAVAAEAVLPGHRPARVASSLALSADIIEAIRRDGFFASALALAGVLVVVLARFGASRTSSLVIGALLTGVVWLVGLDVALGVKLNFSNFIALPITFGIGVEYAVNVATRYEEAGRDTRAAILGTGGAVALCSLTTVIGYSSLLFAQNRALFLFGVLAVLGELTCVTVAVVALPALLELLARRSARTAEGST